MNTKTAKGTKTRVTNLARFKKGTMGFTTYDKLTTLKDNRGRDVSIDRKRVERLKSLITMGLWKDFAGSRATINTFGKAMDGHHTIVAHHELNMPIPYYVSNSDLSDTNNDAEIIDAVSIFNSHSSQWTKKDAFKTALKYKYDLAIRMEEIIDDISAKTSEPTGKIPYSWVFGLLTKNKSMASNSKNLNVTTTYKNSELFEYSLTDEFTKTLDSFIELLRLLKANGIERPANAIFQALHLHWNCSIFEIDRLIDRIKEHGYNSNGYSVVYSKSELQKVYNTQRGRISDYHKLFADVPAHRTATTEIPVYKFVK